MSFNLGVTSVSIGAVDVPQVADPKPQAAHRAAVPSGYLTSGIRRKKKKTSPQTSLIISSSNNPFTHTIHSFDEFSVWQRFSVTLFIPFYFFLKRSLLLNLSKV